MGKNILVTGGSRGIGEAVIKLLTVDGAFEILAPSRRELDISDMGSIETYMSTCPDLVGLVNVAGINILGKLEELDALSIEKMTATNMIGPLKLIQAAVPGMRRCGGGRIVNFSSIWGIRSKEFRTLYSMTKFALTGITKALARELGPDNILVNAVAPGYVLTEMTARNVSVEGRRQLCREIPLRRMAEPAEIARLVRFLISEENSYITGQSIVIDGGFLA